MRVVLDTNVVASALLNFADIFGVFVESKSAAASRAYGAITSHSGRREALERAAEIFFELQKVSEGEQKYFGRLMAHFQKCLD